LVASRIAGGLRVCRRPLQWVCFDRRQPMRERTLRERSEMPSRKARSIGEGWGAAARAARASLVLGLAMALATPLAGPPALAETAQETPKPQGWLGVTLGSGAAPQAGDAADAPAGVLIEGVVADGPARRAGLRGRDRILAVNGRSVSTPSDLMALIKASAPDEWVELSVRRGARTLELKAFLGTRPANTGSMRMLEGWIGVEAIDLPQELREFFGAPKNAGVMISRVAAGSPAESAGLSLGDVVFEIDGEPVRSPGGLAGAIARGGVDNRIQVRLMRGGAEITVEPVIAQKPDKE
jgi:S1-C subfamily serine protease